MRAPLIKNLITSKFGLGYCCLWAFFSLYKRTEQIALRLGVHERNIARYKARFRAGEFSCEGCTGCMKAAVRAKKL